MSYLGRKSPAAVLNSADIPDNSITNAKMADDAVGVVDLSATGTAGTTTFLRGDNSWAVPTVEGEGHVISTLEGAGQFLRTDGDNTCSWQLPGVSQCKSKFYGSPLSSTSLASGDSFTTFTDLQIAITPASGSYVLVLVQTNISGSAYNDGAPLLALFRDTTKIGAGTGGGSRIAVSVGVPTFSGAYHASVADNVSIHHLDNPSANGSTSFTYKVGLAVRGTGSGTAYINRPPTDSDSAEHSTASSSITVIEVRP